MLRMNPPNASYAEVLTACEEKIGTKTLKQNFTSARALLESAGRDYLTRANVATLFQLLQVTGNPVVMGKLTKDDLVNLYDYYFVTKRAGGLYDKFLIAANNQCPFCGGIGQPANLDHFMPKGRYPQFSILPVNLIPACRDCNMGNKGSNFATSASEQIIHPFLDAAHLFNEQWIFARYNPSHAAEPSFISYYVEPPQSWSLSDKKRVLNHFKEFEIEKRYGVQASTRLSGIEAQIKAIKAASPFVDFKSVVLQPIINSTPYVNHWERVMCIALMNDIS